MNFALMLFEQEFNDTLKEPDIKHYSAVSVMHC